MSCFGALALRFILLLQLQDDPRRIVARVEDEAITRSEVQREVQRALGKRETSEAEREALEKELLELVLRRRLVLKYLEKTQQAASEQDIDFAVAQFVKQLGRQEKKLADFLKKEHLTEAELRRQFAWQLGWNRYLEKQLTDENLRKYFEKNPRDFDGTELRVAHILWKAPTDEPAAIAAATALREQIASGKISFAEAAKKYSQAPTAAEGGDLGWIRRHEPMPEAFSLAAFSLERGQISEPVVSPFGVHLIHVSEVKPGMIDWQEQREEVASAVTRYLFNFLATKERKTAKVSVTPE